jgi:single-stranded-DNA-specific exonuclease
LHKAIQNLAPFGPEFEEPIFLIRNLVDSGYSKVVGTDKSHLSLSLLDKHSGIIMKGIAFKSASLFDMVKSKEPIDVLARLTVNSWNNEENLELEVKGIRLTGD